MLEHGEDINKHIKIKEDEMNVIQPDFSKASDKGPHEGLRTF